MKYEDFKKQNTVSSMTKEEVFNVAYKAGYEARNCKSEELLRDVSKILSVGYRSGEALHIDKVKEVLRIVSRYNEGLILCSYTRKYIK